MKAHMMTLRTKMSLAMLTLLGVLGMPAMFDGVARPSARRRHTHADDGALLTDRRDHRERGDVPGWVLVTLMTAGLVIAIWAIAGPALINVFNTALTRILSV